MQSPLALDVDSFSPQVLRILQLAAIEASANRNERGDRICPEHLLVAMLQDGTGMGAELIMNCNLTVTDLRAGNVTPRPKTTP